MRRRIPRSLRKHIRQEKARIRREVLDLQEQEKLINELYQKILKQYADSGNIQSNDKNGNRS
jgi:hypothetical protein